jgi:hypothetical protein
MIKMASVEELNDMKEIRKVENTLQKAHAYLAELEDNVGQARKLLSAGHPVVDLVDDDSDENVETKKRKMPGRSSKDKSHNYAGNKSESEDENDLIPYKIPKKSKVSENKHDKNAETKDEVRTFFVM